MLELRELGEVRALEDLLPQHLLVLAHHLLPRSIGHNVGNHSLLRHGSWLMLLNGALRLLRRLGFLKELGGLLARLIIDCVTVGVVSWYTAGRSAHSSRGQRGRVQASC